MPQNLGRSPETNLSLYETLWQRFSSSSNYLGQNFLSVEIAERELSQDRMKQWIERHPLQRRSQRKSDNTNLIRAIVENSRLLFAMLVLAKAEYLFSTLKSLGLRDDNLFDTKAFRKCSASLNRRDRHDVAEYRKRIGAILDDNNHGILSAGTVLPYRNVNHPKNDRRGGFGVVQRIEVAAGHLKGYNEVSQSLRMKP